MSLNSFPRFLDLPKELQIKIWHSAKAMEDETLSAFGWDLGDIPNYAHAPDPGIGRPILLEEPYTHNPTNL